jgi:hypothetical protein
MLMNWKYITIIILLYSLINGTVYAQNRSLDISSQLIFSIYQHQNSTSLLVELANKSKEELANDLFNDSMKNSFWINIYNSAVQLSAPDSIERNNNKKYFDEKRITVANQKLSLNDIEHGLLRHSKSARGKKTKDKCKFKVSDFEKQFRVENPDWRVFFTLNTAINTDPYIGFFNPLDYNQQLKLTSLFYLRPLINNGKVILPNRFRWYYADAQSFKVVQDYAQSLKLDLNEIEISPNKPAAIKLKYFIGSQ